MSQRSGPTLHPVILVAIGLLIVAAVGVPVVSLAVDALDDEEDTAGPGRTILYGLNLLEPTHGSEVTSPVTLAVESTGTPIAMPEDAVEGAHHYALFVDKNPFTAGGQEIPDQSGIYHFAEPTFELDLSPGEHNLTVVLADNDNVRAGAAPAISVDVLVVVPPS